MHRTFPKLNAFTASFDSFSRSGKLFRLAELRPTVYGTYFRGNPFLLSGVVQRTAPDIDSNDGNDHAQLAFVCAALSLVTQ